MTAPTPIFWVLALLWAVVVWSGTRRRVVVYGTIASTVGLLYFPVLRYGFILDDFFFARPITAWQLAATFWGNWDPHDLGNAQYRPVLAMLLALDYELWGIRTWGYHLTNLIILVVDGVIAYELLGRVTGSASGALLGALSWVTHPLGAAVAGWCAERSDSLMALFYLATLLVLLAPRWGRGRGALVLLLGVLSLGSKEMAATLVAPAALVVVLFASEDRNRRLRTVAILLALTLSYVAWWISLFPFKARMKLGQVLPSAPRVFTPVFAPGDYLEWWHAEDMTWAGLAALWLALVGIGWVLSRAGDGRRAKVYLLALIWPFVTVVPAYGLKPVDIYRLGFLVVFAFALAAAAIIAALERHRLAISALAAALALWFTPLAARNARAWGPGGFQYSQIIRWNLQNPSWDSQLSPEMRTLFRRQVQEHPP